MTRTTACWACSLHARKKFAARATFVSGPFVRHFLAQGFTASDAPRISARRPSRPPAWFSNDIRPRRATPAGHVPAAGRGGRTGASRAFPVSPSSLSSFALRPARLARRGIESWGRAAAPTPIATAGIKSALEECVAMNRVGTMVWRGARSVRLHMNALSAPNVQAGLISPTEILVIPDAGSNATQPRIYGMDGTAPRRQPVPLGSLCRQRLLLQLRCRYS